MQDLPCTAGVDHVGSLQNHPGWDQGEQRVSGDPEAGGSDVATDLPKVVLLVRRAEAPAEPAVPETVEPEPEVAEVPSAADAAADAAYALATADTKTYDRPEFHQEDMPTVKLRKEPARTWTAEDDVLVAAVLPLDVRAEPGPLSSFLGRSLLYRAAHAAAAADAPRLIVLGHFGDQRAQLEAEAQAGFGGPVELREGDVDGLGERGRVLVLDGGALHDPTSVRRLGRVRGAKTSLLLGSYGDGLCVRTNEGRITEMGRGMDEPDGVVAGACSAPLEHYEVLAGVGERWAPRTSWWPRSPRGPTGSSSTTSAACGSPKPTSSTAWRRGAAKARSTCWSAASSRVR